MIQGFWLTGLLSLGQPELCFVFPEPCESGEISDELFRDLGHGSRNSHSLGGSATLSTVLIFSPFCKLILSEILGLKQKFWHCQKHNLHGEAGEL